MSGSAVNYGLGHWGADTVLHKLLHLSLQQTNKAEHQFRLYGKWCLLFAWVPVMGDSLTLIAGLFKVNFVLFLMLVTLGKFARYWFIAQVILASQN